jgi:hypothetical protein
MIMGQEPYASYYIYISSVVKKLNNYLCKDKCKLLKKHDLSVCYGKNIDDIEEAEWYRIILQNDLNIDGTFINQIMNAYEATHRDNDLDYQLNAVLKEVSIYKFDHYDNFIKDWKTYILRGL